MRKVLVGATLGFLDLGTDDFPKLIELYVQGGKFAIATSNKCIRTLIRAKLDCVTMLFAVTLPSAAIRCVDFGEQRRRDYES